MLAKFFAWGANLSVAQLYNYLLIAVELYFMSLENLATTCFTSLEPLFQPSKFETE